MRIEFEMRPSDVLDMAHALPQRGDGPVRPRSDQYRDFRFPWRAFAVVLAVAPLIAFGLAFLLPGGLTGTRPSGTNFKDALFLAGAVFALACAALIWVWLILGVFRLASTRVISRLVVGRSLSLMRLNAPIGSFTISLGGDGLEYVTTDGGGTCPWGDIASVTSTRRYVLLFSESFGPMLIPRRAFLDARQRDEFLDRVELGRKRAQQSPSATDTN